MNDFEKLKSILDNQQEPRKKGDWEKIKYEIERGKFGIEIHMPNEELNFVFSPKTKRLKFICNYKW